LNLNGRQIKNAARTALSLSENKGEVMHLKHLKTVLDVVEAFENDFKAGKKGTKREREGDESHTFGC